MSIFKKFGKTNLDPVAIRQGCEVYSVVSAELDTQYYAAENIDVAQSGEDLVAHYIDYGAAEGRNPHPDFDAKFYQNCYPEVIEGDFNPFYHWIKIGQYKNYICHPRNVWRPSIDPAHLYHIIRIGFDAKFYKENNPDVAKVRKIDVVQHYIDFGADEGRWPRRDFDTQYYLQRYPEVQRSRKNPFYHWITEGKFKGYKSHIDDGQADVDSVYRVVRNELDFEFYVAQNLDVQDLIDKDVVQHYIDKGALEGRNPRSDFDTNFYFDEYLGSDKESINPLYHWGAVGKSKGYLTQAEVPVDANGNLSDLYEVVLNGLDSAYYFMTNMDIAQYDEIDPVQHFIDFGAAEGRNPRSDFNTQLYTERYPEVLEQGMNPFYHWLKIGKIKGYIASQFESFDKISDMLSIDPITVQKTLTARQEDLNARLQSGKLGEMVEKACELEPLISHTKPEAVNIKMPPFYSSATVRNVVALHELQKAAEFKRAKVVLIVNETKVGLALRPAEHLTHVLADIYGVEDILVIFSDVSDDVPKHRYPEGCRCVDFSNLTDGVDEDYREQLCVEYIRSLKPQIVINVNSNLFWNILRSYGLALTKDIDLYAIMFSSQKNHLGYWTGYPVQYFYRFLDLLKGVGTDSEYQLDILSERFMLTKKMKNKMVLLRSPVNPGIQIATKSEVTKTKPTQIFWSGRFSRRRRLDVLYRIAEKLPDVEFRVWGRPILEKNVQKLKKPSNIIFEGEYKVFTDLPLSECDLWLYTSEWDSVPNILLEVAMTGIPIVATGVGGVSEVLQGNAELVENVEDYDAYVSAIKKVLGDTQTARQKAINLRDELSETRSNIAYRQTVIDWLKVEDCSA